MIRLFGIAISANRFVEAQLRRMAGNETINLAMLEDLPYKGSKHLNRHHQLNSNILQHVSTWFKYLKAQKNIALQVYSAGKPNQLLWFLLYSKCHATHLRSVFAPIIVFLSTATPKKINTAGSFKLAIVRLEPSASNSCSDRADHHHHVPGSYFGTGGSSRNTAGT